jgi:hypothetical protein
VTGQPSRKENTRVHTLVLMVPTLKRKHGCLSKLVKITTNTRNVKGYRVY